MDARGSLGRFYLSPLRSVAAVGPRPVQLQFLCLSWPATLVQLQFRKYDIFALQPTQPPGPKLSPASRRSNPGHKAGYCAADNICSYVRRDYVPLTLTSNVVLTKCLRSIVHPMSPLEGSYTKNMSSLGMHTQSLTLTPATQRRHSDSHSYRGEASDKGA